ncbi:MAG: M48 family metallopeptidase [Bacteroidales bacterium]|nr:M48 family metallopeptidase [Bacteroidales bacterium]
MAYVGILTQQRRNNFRSTILLLLFPVLVLVLSYVVYLFAHAHKIQEAGLSWFDAFFLKDFLANVAPFVIGGVAIWFLIAYWGNTTIINNAVHSKPLERKENMRVYNLVENLCMQSGMKMPRVNVIQDNSLNAFASGINEKTYTVTLTTGIIQKLNDQELEGVIAHELMHIKNRDVRLLIISIVFVGIFAFISQIALRMLFFSNMSGGRSSGGGGNRGGGGQALMWLVVIAVAAVGYFFTILMKFAISRKREYMADAGAAEMTRNPHALASALRKISGNPNVDAITREDVAQLFIEHPIAKKKTFMSTLFATHPPIEKRIAVLEAF